LARNGAIANTHWNNVAAAYRLAKPDDVPMLEPEK